MHRRYHQLRRNSEILFILSLLVVLAINFRNCHSFFTHAGCSKAITVSKRYRLANDKHLFKWIDEGILENLEEIDHLFIIHDMARNHASFEKKLSALEAKTKKSLKLLTISVVLGFVAMYAFLK